MNLKSIILISLLYFGSNYTNKVFSQIQYSIGIYPSGSFYSESKIVPNPKREIITFITPALQISKNYFASTLKYSYAFGTSNFREIPKRSSISIAIRREIPFKKRNWNEKLKPYIEIEQSFRDYLFQSNGDLILSEKFKHYSILPILGIDVHLFERFEIEFAYGYRFNKDSFNHLDKYLGLIFNIN